MSEHDQYAPEPTEDADESMDSIQDEYTEFIDGDGQAISSDNGLED